MQPRIVVIEDGQESPVSLAGYFSREGFAVTGSDDGAEGLRLVQALRPDVVLLNLTRPGASGTEVGRELRADARTRHIPIVLLVAETNETERPVADALGADARVARSVSNTVLLATVKALLRKADEKGERGDVTEHLGVRIDRDRHRVTLNGQQCDLTPSEFRLLDTLIREPGRLFTRKELIAAALTNPDSGDRTIDTLIKTLRRKLVQAGDTVNLIQTRPVMRYRFRPAATAAE